MRMTLATAALAASVSTAALAAPQAGPEAGSWAVSVDVGADYSVGGDLHGGAEAPIADLGVLNPALAGVSSTLLIEGRSFSDIYDGAALSIGGEFAYGLSNNQEGFLAVRYVDFDDGSTQVGVADVPALDAQLPVFGEFEGYSAFSVEGGLRQYFMSGLARPYVAGRAGVAFVDSISATFTIPDAGITIADAALYNRTTTFTVGADLGVLIAATNFASVAIEGGVRWTGVLDDDDTAIGGLGLAGINEEGGRISAPVLVRGRLSF